jgi:hypothetical protein
MIRGAVSANAPVLAVAAARLHRHTRSIGFQGLPNVLLLLIVLVIVGVFWARRHPRTGKHVAERSDDWPVQHSEQMDERDNPPWQ